MIVSLLLAMLLNKALRGARYFRMFFVLPLVIPVASIILVWQITNNLLNHFGIAGVEWLNSKWSIAVLVLLYVWKNCGYNIILFTAGLNSIPKDYYETLPCIYYFHYKFIQGLQRGLPVVRELSAAQYVYAPALYEQ